MGLSPAELALTYSTCLGGYNPPPQLPRKTPSHSKRLHDGSVCELFAEVAGISAADEEWREDEPSSSSQGGDEEGLATELKTLFRESRDFKEHTELRRQARHFGRLLGRIRRAQQAAAKAKGPTSNGKAADAHAGRKKVKKQRA